MAGQLGIPVYSRMLDYWVAVLFPPTTWVDSINNAPIPASALRTKPTLLLYPRLLPVDVSADLNGKQFTILLGNLLTANLVSRSVTHKSTLPARLTQRSSPEWRRGVDVVLDGDKRAGDKFGRWYGVCRVRGSLEPRSGHWRTDVPSRY